jgi:plastocyanin
MKIRALLRFALSLGAAASSTSPDVARAATVTGTVSAASVVWVTSAASPRPVAVEMRNVNKTFVPDLLVVPAGSTVRFPNDDPFFHSIYSTSDADPFDIGFYETGPGKDVTFPKAGVLDVHCHIHALMHAVIVVVDGPYANVDGPFALPDVAPGERVVHAWDAASGLREVRVRVPKRAATVTLPLPL